MLIFERLTIGFLFILVSTSCAIGQVPATPPQPTIWSFLGIPQGYRNIHGALFNRRGNLPFLEKKPALKPIAHPDFLESKWDVLKEAAEIKQAEDMAKQKIKAIKYLTKIGCGCYDKEDKISKALQAALNDCTEGVRLATVEAIAENIDGESCSSCGQLGCCSEIVLKTLAELAYERDESGCHKEPSKNVREAAAELLETCCANDEPVIIEEAEGTVRLQPEDGSNSGAEDVPADGSPNDESGAEGEEGATEESDSPSTDRHDQSDGGQTIASEPRLFSHQHVQRHIALASAEKPLKTLSRQVPPVRQTVVEWQPTRPRKLKPMPPRVASQPKRAPRIVGIQPSKIVFSDPQQGKITIQHQSRRAPAIGRMAAVHRRNLIGSRQVGTVQLIGSYNGAITAKVVHNKEKIVKGDFVLVPEYQPIATSRFVDGRDFKKNRNRVSLVKRFHPKPINRSKL